MNQHPSADERLLDKLNEAIEKNLQNEQFGVPEMADAAGLSKSQLNRKLNAITGQSASQFIREYRLKKAHELLQSKAATPTEVAYKVGFSSASYFSTCFKEFYGYSPGEVPRRKPEQPKKKAGIPAKSVWIMLAILILIAAGYISYQQLNQNFTKEQGMMVEGKTIAILPFKTITNDSSSQYAADGVREAILNNIQIIRDLFILPASSTEKYRNTDKPSLEIAKELGVLSIMEGSAQKYGNEFRISVRLINGLTGHLIWAEDYDRDWGNILQTYSEIADSVATNLQAIITPVERRRIDETLNTNPTAYELTLKAKYEKELYNITWNPTHLKNSHNLLDSAIKTDPHYADAYVEKSTNYFHVGNLDSMIIYFDKALDVDPNHPNANNRKARYHQIYGDPDIAIEHYNKALKYFPNHLHTNIFLSQVYSEQKKDVQTGYAYLMKAMDLIGERAILLSDIAGTLYSLGEYEKAKNYYKKQFETSSRCRKLQYIESYNFRGNYIRALQLLDSVCPKMNCKGRCNEIYLRTNVYLGKFEIAEQYIDPWDREDTSWLLDVWAFDPLIGYIYYKLGEKIKGEEALKLAIISNENWSNRNRYLAEPDCNLAAIFAFQNEKDKAYKAIQTINKKGLNIAAFDAMKTDPMFDNLRDDRRFQSIMKQADERKRTVRKQIRELEENHRRNLECPDNYIL